MSLRARIFCAMVLATLCLGLLGAALVWQSLAHARQQQADRLLQAQAATWQRLQAQQMQQLQSLAAQLAAGPATREALAQRMQAMARAHAGLRIDLFDEHAEMLATTVAGAFPEPFLDPLALAHGRHDAASIQGLQQLPQRRYGWLQPLRAGPYLLLLGQDAAQLLPLLAERLPGQFHLLNLRGTRVAASTDEARLFARPVVPARTPQVMTLDAGDPRLAGGPALQLVSQPLIGAQGRVIGSLAWSRPVAQELQQDRQFMQYAAAQIVALVALLTAGLFVFLRHALDPLARNIAVLERLAAGHTEAALVAGEVDAEDESGSVARGVTQIRSELLSLETLRQERVRTRRQQERLIRDQLRSLAENLDPGSREDILQALGAPGVTTPGTPSLPAEAPNVLADLASILGRMSGLVSTQQSRLLKLLREVQASVQTQAMLASLQQELEIAREMQLSILPRQTPDRREVEVAATMIAAKEIGGDFYDYFAIDDDHLAVVIADVSGKGVPAAFFMAISRTLLKSNGLFLRTPGATIAALNDQLCNENDQMMFVTVFYAVLQLSTGRLTYVNAGHNPPLLLRQGGAEFFPKGRNMGLAVLDGQQYHEGTLQLDAGDGLLLFTDGVTEANDAQGALYGDLRLLQAVQSFEARPDRRGHARQLAEHVVAQVRRFEAGAAQADDITVVALTYRGTAA
ncbi:PP2C family protein-serine/threonine phosphatase [Comamonas antarctica]|uniref:PP2C family protein-serine/threonine phosphatase n=1 Tax=Comamonas antarctica TaxID=2743470 RepID=A0A6N1X961_9BURK|nr:PP2C family protein-serine/threonine phosphatase [Comamonas antarctica]QKV54366.1 PP2C family protein-serine/threonine phosphatase [Comamonas antarctica]